MPPKKEDAIKRSINRLQPYLLMNENKYRQGKEKRVIDLDVLRGLGAIGATQEEMALTLGCSIPYLKKQLDENPAFAAAFHEGQASLKTSLRRTQVDVAMSGSVPMLIWLGKQMLGQADKHEQNNKTEISITVQRAMDELRDMPRDNILEAQALLTRGKGAGVPGEASFSRVEPGIETPHPPV